MPYTGNQYPLFLLIFFCMKTGMPEYFLWWRNSIPALHPPAPVTIKQNVNYVYMVRPQCTYGKSTITLKLSVATRSKCLCNERPAAWLQNLITRIKFKLNRGLEQQQ